MARKKNAPLRRFRLSKTMCGPTINAKPGDVIEVDQDKADELSAAGAGVDIGDVAVLKKPRKKRAPKGSGDGDGSDDGSKDDNGDGSEDDNGDGSEDDNGDGSEDDNGDGSEDDNGDGSEDGSDDGGLRSSKA